MTLAIVRRFGGYVAMIQNDGDLKVTAEFKATAQAFFRARREELSLGGHAARGWRAAVGGGTHSPDR